MKVRATEAEEKWRMHTKEVAEERQRTFTSLALLFSSIESSHKDISFVIPSIGNRKGINQRKYKFLWFGS